MSIRITIAAAATVVGAVVAAPSFAQGGTFAGGEAGYIEPAPQFGARAAGVSLPPVERRVMKRGELSPDGHWEWAGGERDWKIRGHTLRLVGGRFVHADSCAHDQPKPALATEEEKLRMREFQIGG